MYVFQSFVKNFGISIAMLVKSRWAC